MFASAGALPARRHASRASSSMRWRRSCRRWSAAACRRRARSPGCRSCRSPRAAAPTTACWSSSSSPFRRSLAVEIIHRFASRAVRRGPAWDCGFPDPSPATQYTADSFAQPIRRVFGEVVFRAREQVDMPPPGDRASGAADRHAARSRLGRDLRCRSAMPSGSPPTSSTSCSS